MLEADASIKEGKENILLQINPIVEILFGLGVPPSVSDRKSDSILGSRPSCAH